MSLSPKTQAVLLLTARFSKPGPNHVKPLGPMEWGRFALWLKDQGKSPDALLSGNVVDHLSGWSDKSITFERIKQLLDRGSALAIASEKWLRSGLWILTRSDAEYPKALKKRLQTSAPPVLFGCGNSRLLNQGGLAVVGSRNASKDDLDYASELGRSAANAGISIISGGARGIDEAAMLGALQVEGTAVGILADSLLRASSSKKYRAFLSENNLALVSPYQPEVSFNAGNAMGRNKYIYCMADTAVVVHSGMNGGTWTGALENLKKEWVPLWVKPTTDSKAGNEGIVRQGASWTSESADQIDVSRLLSRTAESDKSKESEDLFSQPTDQVEVGTSKPDENRPELTNNEPASRTTEFYELFLLRMKAACAEEAQSPDELEKTLEIKRIQLNVWLKRAVEEKVLKKLTRPVRYEWASESRQQSFFSE